MKKLEEQFRYKSVDFKQIKRGEKAIMFEASAKFYGGNRSIEVWQIREAKEVMIKDTVVEAHEMKPSNEDYGFKAHQFMENHFNSFDDLKLEAEKRYNEYETGERPKKQILENSTILV